MSTAVCEKLVSLPVAAVVLGITPDRLRIEVRRRGLLGLFARVGQRLVISPARLNELREALGLAEVRTPVPPEAAAQP